MKPEEQKEVRRPYVRPTVEKVTLVPREAVLNVSTPEPGDWDPADPAAGTLFGH